MGLNHCSNERVIEVTSKGAAPASYSSAYGSALVNRIPPVRKQARAQYFEPSNGKKGAAMGKVAMSHSP